MSKRAEATFAIKSWDETPYDEADIGPKLKRVRVTKTFEGDFTGEATLEYLMVQRDDGTGHFVGLERLVGTLDGRSGSFLLQHDGTFENEVARTTWSVVPRSGTDGLRGLRGQGTFESAHAERYPWSLDFDVE